MNEADTESTIPSPALPEGSVRALIASGRVSAATRSALLSRLAAARVTEPRFFDGDELQRLAAVCAGVVAQSDGVAIDIAGLIDGRLADERGNGWRYDTMPPDGEAYRRGLAGIEEVAAVLFGVAFVALDPRQQAQVLGTVQRGEPPGGAWETLAAARFFEELLAEVAAAYYSHPLSLERIGYLGFADAVGWHAIGLDEAEAPEPQGRG